MEKDNDKYVWYGATFTSGDGGYAATKELQNVAGCDSTLNLFLTIRHLRKDTLHRTICSDEVPFLWRGNSYSESGMRTLDTVYSTTSLVDTLFTLDLTINQAYAVDTTAKACDSYTWRGKTYTESGNYLFNGQTKAGCDSIVTLHLTINKSTSSEQTVAEYDSYTWNGKTYTESGTYTYATTNAAGCDSVATLHLTISERPPVTYETVYFCPGYNTEHEEQVTESLVRRYREYGYESPADWNYKEGMIVEEQTNRTQMDLHRVEANLNNHYVNDLEPIKSIAWSYRAYGETNYAPLEITAGPQWIESGELMIYVRFTCSHNYSEKFVVDYVNAVDNINDNTDGQWQKVLIDGQLYIIRGNAKYTIFGTKVE